MNGKYVQYLLLGEEHILKCHAELFLSVTAKGALT